MGMPRDKRLEDCPKMERPHATIYYITIGTKAFCVNVIKPIVSIMARHGYLPAEPRSERIRGRKKGLILELGPEN
jgi:hypothetical protein